MSNSFEMSQPEPFETQQPESRLSPIRLISRHYMLLIFGAIAGSVVGALYYARATPIYESSTQVLVLNKSPNPLPATDSSESGKEQESPNSDLATQLILIRSPSIIGAAVKQANLAQLPSFAGGGDPTAAVIASLKLGQEYGEGKPTNVLNLSTRGSYPEDLPVVLKAIIESYQQFLKDRYQNVAEETAKLIVDANALLEQKIAAKQKGYDEFLTQLPTELWRGKDGATSIQLKLMSLETKRVDLLSREADLQGRLQALDKAMRDGRHSRAELLTMSYQGQSGANGDRGSSNSQTTDRLMALKLQEKNLLEVYGPEHPDVRSVRDQLALLYGRVNLSEKNSLTDAEDPVESHVQALKLELEYIRIASETLSQSIQKAHREAKPLRSLEIRNDTYRSDISRNQQLFDAIAKRLDEITLLKNANNGYTVEIINPPGNGRKVAPKLFVVLGIALMLGLLGGCGLAYLAEVSDQSFRTPEEIRRHLGLPVVGHVPVFVPVPQEELSLADGLQVDPSLLTAHRPKSREAESIRGVRTALFFSQKGGHALIQVTSPDKGDGKSTLCANLAISIAQAKKKVILIDADFRRPRVHKLFNASADKGLASAISGEDELPDVIQTTPIPGLSVISCGPIPPNPAELLTLPQLKEILDYLREQYDYVLIDTPPLLAVTDPCAVVPHADGVILTIRISKNARPNATRAKEVLSSLGARVIGVVVNGVGTDRKGYGAGYGSYGYGLGYGYGHYYSYKDYHTYSNYESETPSSSDAGEQEGMKAQGSTNTPNNQQPASQRSSQKKSGFFAWLLDR